MTKNELRQMWEKRIADLQSSGQSIPAWSNANNLKLHQVRYWQRQFKNQATSSESSPQWLSVKICDVNQSQPRENSLLIKVGAITIEVKSGFDPELLLEVVRTLSAIC
jgi:hypothetical protein